MTNQTPVKADDSVKKFFQSDAVQHKFKQVLGNERRARQFVVSVLDIIDKNEMLKKADHNSLLFAAATAASLDLPVNSNLGMAYIIPYNDSKTGTVKAQFQMGYKGFIQLAQRSGLVQAINASPIYEGQITKGNPLHGYEFDFEKKTSETIIGYAAYMELTNGFRKVLYMTTESLNKHGKRYSQTFKKGYGLWKEDFDTMAIKTVIKLLLSKYAPLSIDSQISKALLADQGVVKDWDGNEIDYVDNDTEPLPLNENNQVKEEERLKNWIEDAQTKAQLLEAEDSVKALKNASLTKLFNKKLKELDI